MIHLYSASNLTIVPASLRRIALSNPLLTVRMLRSNCGIQIGLGLPPRPISTHTTADMDCAARTSEYPVCQSMAESLATGSFCGDMTHVKPIRITECSVEKMLVLYMSNASNSIVHGSDVAPWEVIPEPKLVSPLVLPSSEFSRSLLALRVENENINLTTKSARMLEERKVCQGARQRYLCSGRLIVSQAAGEPTDSPVVTVNLHHQDRFTSLASLTGNAKETHETGKIMESITAQPSTDIVECMGCPAPVGTLQS